MALVPEADYGVKLSAENEEWCYTIGYFFGLTCIYKEGVCSVGECQELNYWKEHVNGNDGVKHDSELCSLFSTRDFDCIPNHEYDSNDLSGWCTLVDRTTPSPIRERLSIN